MLWIIHHYTLRFFFDLTLYRSAPYHVNNSSFKLQRELVSKLCVFRNTAYRFISTYVTLYSEFSDYSSDRELKVPCIRDGCAFEWLLHTRWHYSRTLELGHCKIRSKLWTNINSDKIYIRGPVKALCERFQHGNLHRLDCATITKLLFSLTQLVAYI